MTYSRQESLTLISALDHYHRSLLIEIRDADKEGRGSFDVVNNSLKVQKLLNKICNEVVGFSAPIVRTQTKTSRG